MVVQISRSNVRRLVAMNTSGSRPVGYDGQDTRIRMTRETGDPCSDINYY